MGWEGRWTTTGDPSEFLTAAAGFLTEHRVELTVPLSIVHRLAEHGPSFYDDEPPQLAWYGEDTTGPVSAVAVQTPPHQLVVSPLTASAAAALAAHRDRPHRILADTTTASRLAAAWGARPQVVVRQRLHRLTELIEPLRTGASRVAEREDSAMVWSWLLAFHAEALPDNPPPRRAGVDAALAEHRVLLHEVDGCPVALAMVSPPDLGVSRIGPVYTPPEQRRRGHAAAVMTAAVRAALRRGAEEVVLFTDLANPTSNALYARLGFAGLRDVVEADLLVP